MRRSIYLAAALIMLIGCAWRQPPASIRALPTKPLPPQAAAESAPLSAAQLDEVVARVALYPDELLALVLPASTQPIQIVEAARFLAARDRDPQSTPMESWDASVRSLLNYPDVIRLMNEDLAWTEALGDAVTNRQADVMEAIQQVRTRALAAGNLKTNAQQAVTQEVGVIRIASADPEVIYVPIYDPTVIYVMSPVQIVTYYPPYPCYWCPNAAYGVGIWMGFDWYYHDIYYDDYHHHDDHYDHDRPVRPERPDRPDNVWKPSRPVGGERPSGRPSTLPAQPGLSPNRPGPGGPEGPISMDRLTKLPSAGNLPGSASRPSTLPGARPGYQKPSTQDSLGGYERGRDAIRDGNRGAQSRGLDSGGRGAYGDRSAGGGSSWGGYGAGNSANAWSSRGAASRGGMYGGGGGGFGGGSRGGGGGGGGRGR